MTSAAGIDQNDDTFDATVEQRRQRLKRAAPLVLILALMVFSDQSALTSPDNTPIAQIAADNASGSIQSKNSTKEAALGSRSIGAVGKDVPKPFEPTYLDGESAARALTCLTEAVYYEGSLEPENGQRAIAQVVLNRVRHPEYPNTVCGVVYQGQHRSTGCQFTFTCDGSRGRQPLQSLWGSAEEVAKAALGGAVYEDVGMSTHYHADYVVPHWSRMLDNSGQIGRHIFYRWRGRPGKQTAFTSAYGGTEPLIADYEPADNGVDETMSGEDAPETTADETDPEGTAMQEKRPFTFEARPLRLVDEESDPL